MQQTTIRKSIECTGIGLHSGKTVRLGLRPAAEGAGIVFHVRTASGIRDLAPSPHAVIATGLATTLGSADGEVRVATVEHILAAIRALNIDNIHIDAEGEIPIMDGSAATFTMLLEDAGLRRQHAPRAMLRVTKPLSFGRDGKAIQVRPYAGFFVDCTIDFPHPLIGVQRKALEITPETFTAIARARTFGFLRDVEMMRARGLGLGGSLDNAVVLDECGVVNQDGLRFADEFVRHKILDFVGDMAMLGCPLQGHFTIHCSGHAVNNAFLRALADNASIYLEPVATAPETAAPIAAQLASRPLGAIPAMQPEAA
jgi:UDP-3-O-[3-hydroxymyristoyl] N-acetylglucosamine deacetylase